MGNSNHAVAHARSPSEPVSRRHLLGTAAGGVAAIVVAGCQKAPATGDAPKLMFLATNLHDPDPNWPAIPYLEAVEAVRQFEEKFGVRYAPDTNILSVTLATSPKEAEEKEKGNEKDPPVFFHVRYVEGRQKPEFPRNFAYDYPGTRNNDPTPIVVRPEPMPKPHGIRLGHRARHANLTVAAAGSVGWIIRFNGDVVCVSAYHVLRDNVNPAGGIDDNVELNTTVNADLYCYQPLAFDGSTNTWDVAMAKLRSEADVDREFRDCAPAGDYPMRLSAVAGPTSGDAFKKVGNGNPVCGSGKYVEAGSIAVEYPGDKIAVFRGQLFFTQLAGVGDSGAVITRSDDKSVTGLHFTGTSTRSISCPMFLMPWVRKSNYVLAHNSRQLPNYTAVDVAAPRCCGAPVVP